MFVEWVIDSTLQLPVPESDIAMSDIGLLQLPPEVLHTILNFAIPVRRLCTRPLLDNEFKLSGTSEGREVPALLLVSRKTHTEASTIFYSRAILELAPPKTRPPASILTRLDSVHDGSLTLSPQLDNEFSFVAQRTLSMIHRVYVYSDQRHVIEAEAYEALLRWLISRTRVCYIHLSKRLLCRVRKCRVQMQPASLLRSLNPVPSRAIQIFSSSGRNEWERVQRRQAEAALGSSLPWYHVACGFWKDGRLVLQFDARWDARSTDFDEYREQNIILGKFLDRLLGEVPKQHPSEICYRSSTGDVRVQAAQNEAAILAGCSDDSRPPEAKLYQVIFVLEHEPE